MREAPPEDGRVVLVHRGEDICVHDPTGDDERLTVAASCAIGLDIRMPVMIDRGDDAVASAYGALPDPAEPANGRATRAPSCPSPG